MRNWIDQDQCRSAREGTALGISGVLAGLLAVTFPPAGPSGKPVSIQSCLITVPRQLAVQNPHHRVEEQVFAVFT